MNVRIIPAVRAAGALAGLLVASSCLTGVAHAATADVFSAVQAPAGAALTRLADDADMRVVLSLPLSDAAGAQTFAEAVTDPRSPLHGAYLTPAQFGARFGASTADYEALRSWAETAGFKVGPRTDSRSTISLGGTARQFAAVFHTEFASFANRVGGDGLVMRVAPSLPAALAGRVNGVIGLSYARKYVPMVRVPGGPRADVGTGKGGGYAPADIRAAYNIPDPVGSTQTETVAVFEQGYYSQSDLDTYTAQYGLRSVPVTARPVNGSGNSKPFGVLLEAQLDLDVLNGLNPNLKNILYYYDSKDSFQTALLDSLNQMAQDDEATVISISYGQSETAQGMPAIQAENTALIQLRAQGQSVFASSGDSGADNLNVSDPASQPNLTSVGGTTLNTNPTTQAWVSETVWSGGGGGVSAVWPIPSYQLLRGKSVATANGGSATMRNVPDIAADADLATGYSVYCPGLACEGLGWGPVGGTSLASPIWAAMTSVVNADRAAAGKPRVGFLNTNLYPAGRARTGFHDITVGNNGSPGYLAGPGYDDATGYGSIDLATLLPIAVNH